MEISVIIPVYGVELWIERCVRSLMEQTIIKDVEFIFVNDASQDKSMEIVYQTVSLYPNRKNQVIFIEHKINKGLPAARNTGLSFARGKYVFHCDSDDFLEPDMLEKMLEKANKFDADIVWCDWFLTFRKNERRMREPHATTPIEALKSMLNGSLKYNVWNKLIRRNLFTKNNIIFPEGHSMGEDMTIICLVAKAKCVANVSEPFYHYVKVNCNAMTHHYSEDKLESLKHNVLSTIQFLRSKAKHLDIDREISFFLLNVKLPFLFSGLKEDINRWGKWYPEANKMIMYNQSQALRTRLLQWCAAHNFSFLNILYARYITNFIYGKIFK